MSIDAAHLDRLSHLVDIGDFARARPVLEAALRVDPKHPELVSLLGYVLMQLGDFASAEPWVRELAALMPDHPRVLHNLGNCLTHVCKFEEAEQVLGRALARLKGQAGESETRVALGQALVHQRKLASAERVLSEGLAKDPAHATMRNNRGHALLHLGRAEEAVREIATARQAAPHVLMFASGACAAASYVHGASRADIRAVHAEYGRMLGEAVPLRPRPAQRVRGATPLRVGLLSPDLRRHAVACFLMPLLEHARGAGLAMYGISLSRTEDDVTARLRALCAGWASGVGRSMAEAAEIVRAMELDVLVDLAGHTMGHAAGMLNMRAAPRTVSFLGYPTTTGVGGVDVRLTDGTIVPPGNEDEFTERVVRMEGVCHCYTPLDAPPPVNALPALGKGGMTFGCFGALPKMNDHLMRAWGALLSRVPDARLIVRHEGLREAEVRDAMRARLAACGIDTARVEVREPVADQRGVFEAYNEIDVALDTWPYTGTTTICEALTMGVPTVTLRGDRSAARVGASLMDAAGLGDWVTVSVDGYVERAVRAAAELDSLAALRSGLRAQMEASALCDGEGFARRFAAAMREIVDTPAQ